MIVEHVQQEYTVLSVKENEPLVPQATIVHLGSTLLKALTLLEMFHFYLMTKFSNFIHHQGLKNVLYTPLTMKLVVSLLTPVYFATPVTIVMSKEFLLRKSIPAFQDIIALVKVSHQENAQLEEWRLKGLWLKVSIHVYLVKQEDIVQIR
jgi:hypothetical protein